MTHHIQVGDQIEWQGQTRKVVKLLSVAVALEGAEDMIAIPIDATRVEVFKAKSTDEQRGKNDSFGEIP